MYTQYYLELDNIVGLGGPTGFYLCADRICSTSSGPTSYFLAEAHFSHVKHIYGPQGFTKYYFCDDFIYGPTATLPWQKATEPSSKTA